MGSRCLLWRWSPRHEPSLLTIHHKYINKKQAKRRKSQLLERESLFFFIYLFIYFSKSPFDLTNYDTIQTPSSHPLFCHRFSHGAAHVSQMDLMHHSSTFLLPTIPQHHRPSLTYALVVLNQTLPRFAPLLWKHGTYPASSSLFPVPVSVWGFNFFPSLFCLVQLSFVSVLMVAPIVCSMKCLCISLRKMPPMFDAGFFFLVFIYCFCVCLIMALLKFIYVPLSASFDLDSYIS